MGVGAMVVREAFFLFGRFFCPKKRQLGKKTPKKNAQKKTPIFEKLNFGRFLFCWKIGEKIHYNRGVIFWKKSKKTPIFEK